MTACCSSVRQSYVGSALVTELPKATTDHNMLDTPAEFQPRDDGQSINDKEDRASNASDSELIVVATDDVLES